jgi:hypothetical protein
MRCYSAYRTFNRWVAAGSGIILSSRFMGKSPPPLILLLAFLASGCAVQQNYLMSPLDLNSNTYHAMPLHSDSIRSAIYGNLGITNGIYNYEGRDNLYSFSGQFHRSHDFRGFQAYYGAGLSIGSYHVSPYSIYEIEGIPLRDTLISVSTGSHQFFGAYGFNGGMNLVVPLPGGGEWRIIGFETFVGKEFGSYLNFRKSLPDSAGNILETNAWTETLGGTSEILWKRRSGTELGYKIALGGTFISAGTYRGNRSYDLPYYFSHTFHLSKGNFTGYCQLNFGVHSGSFQFGMNYQLSAKNRGN